MRKRRKTAKAALLCLFCALLMAALPVTALAETEPYEPVAGLLVTVNGANNFTQEPEKGLTVKVRGLTDLVTGEYASNTATITLTNQSESAGTLSFDWAATSVNELVIDGTTETTTSGGFEKRLGAGDDVEIIITTGPNTTTNKLEISGITFTEGTPEPEHNYVPVVTAPTCTEEGYTTYTCTSCEEEHSYKDNIISALGHTEVIDEAVTATCTTPGLTEGKHCSVCNEVLEAQQETTALGHTPTDAGTETPPTCTEAGYTTYTCSSCGHGYTTPGADELGHSFTNYDSDNNATCTADGTKTAKCGRCDATETVTDTGSAKGHQFVKYTAQPPSCTEKGRKEHWQCSVCGLYFAPESAENAQNGVEDNSAYLIEETGHDLKDHEGRNPTYTQAGWAPYQACTRCDHTTKASIPALQGGPKLESYGEFVASLARLEELANLYCSGHSGADALGLILGYISGREADQSFGDYVAQKEEEFNAVWNTPLEEYLEVTALKEPGIFTLPNGQRADLGYLFGVMASIHQNSGDPGAAEADGWAGGLLELVKAADAANLSGTAEEIIPVLEEGYFAKDAGYSQARLFADLDGVNLMKAIGDGYSTGELDLVLRGYFTAGLSEADRAELFLQNRLSGSTTRQQIGRAIHGAYSGNRTIGALKNAYVFESNTETLAKIEEAACRVFADYLCRRAGIVGQVDLSLSDNAIRARERVSLTVALEDGFRGLSGYQFTVKYDPELFEVKRIDTAGSPGELGAVARVDAQNGEITFKTNGQVGANRELSGPMAVIDFIAKKTAHGTAQFAVTDAVLNIIENGQGQTHPAVGSWKTGQSVVITPILPGDADYDGLLTQIVVSGLEAPEKYQMPDCDYTLSEGPVQNGQAVWSPEPNFGGKFAADTAYALSIPYVLHEYYTLDETLAVTVEGLESGRYTAVLENGFIRITFAKTEPKAPTGLDLRVLNSQNGSVTTAAVPYAGTTAEYTVAAWVLYDDGSEERLDQAFDCTAEGGEGTGLTQSENGWKLILHPSARAGEMILKIGCTLEGRQLTDQRSLALTRETDRLTRLEIIGEETVKVSGGTTTQQYTALGHNQYGEEMAVENVVWSLTQAADGVSVDSATGMLTITGRGNQSVALRIDSGEIFAEKTVALRYQPVSSGGSYRPKEEKPEDKVEEKNRERTDAIVPAPDMTVAPVEETPLAQPEPETLPLPPAAEKAPPEDATLPQRADTKTTPEDDLAAPAQGEKPRGVGGMVVVVTAAGAGAAVAALGWRKKKKR